MSLPGFVAVVTRGHAAGAASPAAATSAASADAAVPGASADCGGPACHAISPESSKHLAFRKATRTPWRQGLLGAMQLHSFPSSSHAFSLH